MGHPNSDPAPILTGQGPPETTQPPLAAAAPVSERYGWVEIFRGLAILEVVFHHVTGKFLREFELGSLPWMLLAVANQTLHYGVPAFLMLSAFVLMAAMLRRFDAKKYSWNRIQKAVWPYLLWCGIYLAYKAYVGFGASGEWNWALFKPTLPLANQLVWGKVYFHLYFLAIAIQLYLLLPFMLPFFRKRPPFWGVFLAILLITMGAYWHNRLVYRMPYVGSYILWYTPTILLGLWLASQASRLKEITQKGLVWSLLIAAVGLWIYLPLTLKIMRGHVGNTFEYQVGAWLFTSGISFAMLWWAIRLDEVKHRAIDALRFTGRYSLQIYLIHPMIIQELARIRSFPEPLGHYAAFAIYFGTALLIPLVIGVLLHRARLSNFVFGR